MIRNPSDGSVKEVEHQPKPLGNHVDGAEKPVLNTGTSGLPIGSSKPTDVQRLQASRHWLQEYHASRNPEKVVRELGEGSEGT